MDPIKELKQALAMKMQEQASQNGEAPTSFTPDPSTVATDFLNKKQAGALPDMRTPVPNQPSFQGGGIANVEGATDAFALDMSRRQAMSDSGADSSRNRYVDPESINPLAYTQEWTSMLAENVHYGVGQLIGDYGDIAQVLGNMVGFNTLEGGNAISRTLQDWGYGIQGNAKVFEIPELQDITWSSLLDARFWAQEGGRFIPQLAEILGTAAISGGIATGVKKGIQGIVKKELKDILAAKTTSEVAEGLVKSRAKGFRVTTPGQSGTSRGITEMVGSGKGWRGFMMTDRGELTSRFSQIVKGVSGGVLMNQRVALANAGEMYNTYADLNRQSIESGQGQLFTEEELGEMAAQTYANTSAYIGADILSWSLTFGGGLGKIRQSGLNPFKKTLSKEAQRTASGGAFVKSVSPVLKASFRLAKKALPEGFEETIQETWEEWSKMKSYQDVRGSMEGYQGKASKEYTSFGNGGFFDYYASKDAEAIKVIAGAMGAMAGGAFNVRTLFDKSASDAHKMYNRAENLKTIFREGTEGKKQQRLFIQGQLADLVYDGGTAELFGGFINHLYDNDIISEQEVDEYMGLAQRADKAFQNISDLNITPAKKKLLMDNVLLADYYESQINEETELSKGRIELLTNTIEDPAKLEEAINNEKEVLESRIKGIASMFATAEENIQNLMVGKDAQPILSKTTVDNFGNETIIEKDEADGTNDEVSVDAKDNRENVETNEVIPASKQKEPTLKGKAKDIVDNVVNGIKNVFSSDSKNPDAEAETTTQPVNPKNPNLDGDGNVIENTDGAIEALNETVGSDYSFIDETDQDLDIISMDDNIGDSMPENITIKDSDGKEETLRLNRNASKTNEEAVYQYSDPKSRKEKGDRIIRKKSKSNSESTSDSQNESKKEVNQNSEDKAKSIGKTAKEKAKEAGIELTDDDADLIDEILSNQGDSKKESEKSIDEKRQERKSKKLEKPKDSPINPFEKRDPMDSPNPSEKLAETEQKQKKKSIFNLDKIKRTKIIKREKDIRFYNDESTNVMSNSMAAIAEMITVNKRLEQIFQGDPLDYKPKTFIIDNLYDTYGVDAVGFSIAGANYIQYDHWNQDDVFMHEMAHIYYQLLSENPETKKFMEYASRNKKLVDYIKQTYWDQEQIAVLDEDGEVVDVVSIMDIEQVQDFLENVEEMTPEMLENIQGIIDSMVNSETNKDGNLQRIPMSGQFIWNEEIFTHTLEGPLSDIYNKFFQDKIDVVRQRKAKRWWNFTKEKLTDSDPNTQLHHENELTKILGTKELDDYNTSREKIIRGFKNSIHMNGATFSIHGMAARKRMKQRELGLKEQAINERIKKSINDNRARTPISKQKDTLKDLVTSILEESHDDRYDKFYAEKINVADNSINNILKAFASFYNKVLSVKFFNEGGKDMSTIPHFDGDSMRVELFHLAKNSNDSIDFIAKIEESDIQEIMDFNKFLNAKMKSGELKAGKKESFLNTMYWVYSNKKDVQGIHTYVSANGQVKVEHSRNNNEQAKIENQLALLRKRSVNRRDAIKSEKEGTNFNEKLNEEFMALVSAGNRIKRGIGTSEDVYTIVQYFSPNGVNVEKLVEEDVIIIKGSSFKLSDVIQQIVFSPRGMNLIDKTDRTTPEQTLANYGTEIHTNKKRADGSQETEFKPIFRDLVQALVITNRKWTSDETVSDAAGNQNPSRITNNYFTKMVDNVEEIAKTKGRKGFLRLLAGITKEGRGSLSNNLLNYWYGKVEKGLPLVINQNFGVRNDKLGTAVNFDESTTEEDMINQVTIFFSTLNKSNGNYIMDAGRFADSARSFYLEVPFMDMSELGEIRDRQFHFKNTKEKGIGPIIQSAYNSYQKLHGKESLSFDEWQRRLNVGIKEQIDFVNERSDIFSGLSSFKDMFDENGQLNKNGMIALANMEINNTINGVFFSEVFFPSYDVDGDLSKRSKSAASPFFSLHKNVGVQSIYFTDPEAEAGKAYGGSLTDGVAYMLAEEDENGNPILEYNDIARISDMGGESMDLGHSLKFGGFGREFYNESFAGKNIYDKPSVQPLNAKIVAQQPRLKPLYDRMMAERKKYLSQLEKEGRTFDPNLLSGADNQVLWAVSATANKAKNLPENYNSEVMSLDSINSEEAGKILDSWYYKDGKFNGLMGENYGVQTVMDKQTDKSVLPVQLLQSIITNADINDNLGDLQSVISDVTKQMEENFIEVRDTILYGSDDDIRELMMNHFSMANMEPRQADLIKEGLSLSIPDLRTITMNTLSNVVKRNSNKLVTPGAMAHSAPSFYEKKGITNGGKTLQDYRRNPDGTTSKIEAVVPSSMMKTLNARTQLVMSKDGTIQGDLRGATYKMQPLKKDPLVERIQLDPRERFVLETKHLAQKKAKAHNVGYGPVYENIGGQELQVGWYVEGDTILVSRIPSHGVQTTGVAEVVDFNASKSDAILLPNEFIKRIGGDHDGDAIFINHKGLKTHNWNVAFDKIVKHWLSPEMANEVMLDIEYESEATQAVKKSEEVYAKIKKKKQLLYYSFGGRANNSDNTRGAKRLIGMMANLNTRLNQMRSYNIPFKSSFSINGTTFSQFQNRNVRDANGRIRSIGISSSKMMNLVIDNAKYPFSAELNINPHTAGIAMVLTNLGLDLTDIGLILNNPIALAYTKVKANKTVWNNSVLKGNTNELIRKKVEEDFGLKVGSVKGDVVSVSTKGDLTTPDAMAGILRLLNIASDINSDLVGMNSIMSGHTDLDVNSFIIQDNLRQFESILNNENNSQLIITDEFRNDPIVKNYLRTAKDYVKMANKLDPSANPAMAKMHQEIVQSNASYMDNYSKHKLQESFEVYNAAMANGFQNLGNVDSEAYMNSLIDPNSSNYIYARIERYLESKTIVDPDDVRNSVPGHRASFLFSKGLKHNSWGQNKFLSLNNSFYKSMAPELRGRLVQEFADLKNFDKNLVKDLVLFDLFTHGWSGPNSMFPLFPKEIRHQLSQKINYRNKSNPGMTVTQYDNLMRAIIAKNHGSLLTANMRTYQFPKQPISNKEFQTEAIYHAIKNNGRIRNLVEAGSNGVFFKIAHPNPNGTDLIAYVPPLNHDQKVIVGNQPNKQLRGRYAVSFAIENIKNSQSPNLFYADTSGNFIKVIASNSPKNTDGKSDEMIVTSSSKTSKASINKSNQSGIQGRQKKNPYLAKNKLSRAEFDTHMEYDPGVTEARKQILYQDYLDQKAKADNIYRTLVNESTVKHIPTDELMKLYGSRNPLDGKYKDGEKGYGYRNLFAYANVVDAINKELVNRIANEQEQITGRKYDGKDISPVKAFFMSNNIPSNHPAVQGVVRHFEREYKTYIREKNKYVSQINEATEQLYEEQFGLKMNSKNIFQILKNMYYGLFKNRADFYEKLYGPLIVHEVIMDDDGNTVNNMRYKTKEEIEEGFSNGTISKAQKKFYDVTTEMTNHLKKFNVDDDSSGRTGYIPHTAPALMEAYARRGLLGLMVNSKTIDERISDVKMSFINPITGTAEKASFNDIKNIYTLLSKDKSNAKYAADFYALKKKAIGLARKGINEDGTALSLSNIETGSALGDTFMERFSSARSNKAADFPSLDLNKAFVDYVSGSMFTNGNENFSGFKKMLPIVDGLITNLTQNDNPQMANYVKKIWKEYFLKGSKQKSGIYNTRTLEALGITTDDTIDYLTKASLLYWLGFKGLAIGGGAYAIGNVLVGKYKNITNNGGKAWKKGEARFWGVDEGISMSNFGPANANAILKRIGFMDINVYDDVNVDTKNSFEKNMVNFALMPMTISERWIQGVQFLGLLTDQEWADLKAGGTLSSDRINVLEEEVKRSQGKGYQATDQRMIQLYSWGRNMLQFSRFVPTMVDELLGERDIDRYGKERIGTYRMHYEAIQKVVMGNMNPKEFVKYRKDLTDDERRRFDGALIGFGVLAFLGTAGSNTATDLFWDSNAVFDLDKLHQKIIPPSVNMVDNVLF